MKQLIGNSGTSYTFDASAKTITINGLDNLDISAILLINNVTAGTIIYNPFSPSTGYTSIVGNTITLEFDTTSQNDTDVLQIFYDDMAELSTTLSDVSVALKILANTIANPMWAAANGLTIGGGNISNVSNVLSVSQISNILSLDNYNIGRGLLDPLLTPLYNDLRSRISIT